MQDNPPFTNDGEQPFPLTLSELDQWLLAEGTHERPYTQLGAHPCVAEGIAGVRFAVWAPNARRVSVIGSFNHWDGRQHPMHLHRNCGVWERFIPLVKEGDLYKYEVEGAQGGLLLKADPFAFRAQLRPDTASVVHHLPEPAPTRPERLAANAKDAPISIYEVHLGSWRRQGEHGNEWLSYRQLAEQLIPYVQELGFTHIELMPINEHPFDGSWGYQPTGLYAATARFGSPDDLRYFIEVAHEAGIGVLLDWVPGHFPTDHHGLGQWDGSHLYEHSDPREGWHQDWNTLIYNFGRSEVRNFLVGNALFWIERFGIDGLRVDAVASMLYRDYSRKEGQWIPNQYGGRENLEAINLLRNVNQRLAAYNASNNAAAITLAEESTSFPQVSHPVAAGGLGFSYKWNMGWMHDTLKYMQQDPIHRQYHHDQMTFGMVYAFSENFVLPLSHDEVVHGKGSLLGKMPGDEWQRFANLRAYYGFMWGHPGKKLLFMGGEFAQSREWQADYSLDWHLLQYPLHQGVQRLIRDLNAVYRAYPALYQLDCVPRGFQWMVQDDRQNCVFAFARSNDAGQTVIVISNFTPVAHLNYQLGVPLAGSYRELINTDATIYGGSGVGSVVGSGDGSEISSGVGNTASQVIASHGQAQSIRINIPPLATLFLLCEP